MNISQIAFTSNKRKPIELGNVIIYPNNEYGVRAVKKTDNYNPTTIILDNGHALIPTVPGGAKMDFNDVEKSLRVLHEFA